MQVIDLGPFKEFNSKIKRIQSRFKDRAYRFSKMLGVEGDFWVFEEEDDEEIIGGVLRVQEGRVYALSDDVYALVQNSLSRRQ